MTCLSVSTDGSVLLSGSHDESVRLWDVKSKQSMRTVTLKGAPRRAPPHGAPPCLASREHVGCTAASPDFVFCCVLQAQ